MKSNGLDAAAAQVIRELGGWERTQELLEPRHVFYLDQRRYDGTQRSSFAPNLDWYDRRGEWYYARDGSVTGESRRHRRLIGE